MPTLLALLKINLVLSACYLLYRLFLSRLTFFNLNRAFLAGSILVSVMAPFLSFTIKVPPPVSMPATAQLLLPANAGNLQQVPAAGIDWIYTIQFIYWTGTLLMGGMLLFKLASLGWLYYKSDSFMYKGCRVRTLEGKSSPFSFFRSIFLNPQHYDEVALAVIIAHEKVHIRQCHSLDILLSTLIRIACWYNPLVWLLDKELQRNLEFIADNQVLQKGTERRQYQLSLLSVVTGKTSISLPAYFNFSHLKIRIHMMNKQRSAPIQLTKYAASLVVMAALLLSVSLSFGQQQTVQPAQTKKATEQPSPATQKAPLIIEHKKLAPNYNKSAHRAKLLNAKVITVKAKAVTANGTVAPETTADEATDTQPVITVSNAPLIIVDGKVWGESLVDINPTEVVSMKFLKDAPGIAQYVDAAKNGVILIATKK